MTDFNSLKKQFDALSSICSVSADQEDALRVFRSRMSIMVMRVWSAQPGFHEDYIPALALMTEGEEMSEEDICDFMAQAAAKPVIPMLPAFVQLTVAAGDKDPSICRRFVDSLVSFLTDMAFVNGDCTPEEANEIEAIRMVHMDFYNEYMLTKRRVKSGAVPAGKFTYNRYDAVVEYVLREDGSTVINHPNSEDLPENMDSDIYLSPSRYSDDVIKVDMQLAKPLGITDVKVHAWWFDNKLNITGQLYAKRGLQKRFDMQATLYDRDGDVLEQDTNEYYGGGGIRCSTVRQENFFPGYPFRFVFLSPAEAKEDIARIKISFSGIDD